MPTEISFKAPANTKLDAGYTHDCDMAAALGMKAPQFSKLKRRGTIRQTAGRWVARDVVAQLEEYNRLQEMAGSRSIATTADIDTSPSTPATNGASAQAGEAIDEDQIKIEFDENGDVIFPKPTSLAQHKVYEEAALKRLQRLEAQGKLMDAAVVKRDTATAFGILMRALEDLPRRLVGIVRAIDHDELAILRMQDELAMAVAVAKRDLAEKNYLEAEPSA